MRMIAADTRALAKDLQRGPIGPGLHAAEANMLVDDVADRLYSRPAGRRRMEQRAREVFQFAVYLAVAVGCGKPNAIS